jgi:hypothetical protein
MLHFLIGTALCIWIAERIAHYMHERRMRKLDREYIAWLRPRMEDSKPAAPPQPEQERRRDTYVTVGLCVAFAGLLLSIAVH